MRDWSRKKSQKQVHHRLAKRSGDHEPKLRSRKRPHPPAIAEDSPDETEVVRRPVYDPIRDLPVLDEVEPEFFQWQRWDGLDPWDQEDEEDCMAR